LAGAYKKSTGFKEKIAKPEEQVQRLIGG